LTLGDGEPGSSAGPQSAVGRKPGWSYPIHRISRTIISRWLAGQATGTYIDIGAGHPIADNVSFWFYERGWQGVVVEPQSKLAALYPRLRPRDVAVAGLIGRENGEADFHIVGRLHGLSTTKEGVAKATQAFGVHYQTMRTPTTTLAKLCERHDFGTIDFLKIDVEGAEGDVLFGGDWERFRPKVVVAEAVTPMASEPCACRKSNPDIFVMQSADDRAANNTP
jgi:FkbM family methyltransferase